MSHDADTVDTHSVDSHGAETAGAGGRPLGNGTAPGGAAPSHGASHPTTTQPSAARIYDFWLDGKDNYQVDREVGLAVMQRAPWVVAAVKANRAFLVDAVHRVAEAGITQFLDIGSGLPTSPNVHEIARQVSDEYSVVYVDNDPLVLSNARAQLATDGREPGRDGPVQHVHVLDGDLLTPRALLRDLERERWLDLDRPVGLLLLAVLHFVPDDDDARQIVATFAEHLCPGSYVVISHTSAEHDERGRATREAAERYTSSAVPIKVRTRAEVASLFAPCDLIAPGLHQLSYEGDPAIVLAGTGVVR